MDSGEGRNGRANHSLHSSWPCQSLESLSKNSLAFSGRLVCRQLTTYSLRTAASSLAAAAAWYYWSRQEKTRWFRWVHSSRREDRLWELTCCIIRSMILGMGSAS